MTTSGETATTIFEKQEFDRFRDRDSGAVFENLEFRNCEFGDTVVSIARDPALRSTIRNCTIIKCKTTREPGIESSIVEDVLVDTFSTSRDLWMRGAVFKHVTLRGPIGCLVVTDQFGDEPEVQAAFEQANRAYYRNVDWALDISQAQFTRTPEFRSVPGHLIVRDPTTQVLVTRERVESVDWRSLDFGITGAQIGLGSLLSGNISSEVFVAAKRSKTFREEMKVIELMKEVGLAEPDDVGLTADAGAFGR